MIEFLKKKTGDVLPYDDYPMLIEEGQVFVIGWFFVAFVVISEEVLI